MSSIDPKLIALQFTECINHQSVEGISRLMTESHRFIDQTGTVGEGKESMTKARTRFFELCPEYMNTFERVETNGNLVLLYRYATWKKGDVLDYAIWTVTIENDLVAEWRIYDDTENNRKEFRLI